MKRETRRYGIAFAVLLVPLGGLLIWNLNAGSFPMTAPQVLAILFGQGGDEDGGAGSFGISVCRGFWGRRYWAAHCRFPAFYCRHFSPIPLPAPLCWGFLPGPN